MEDRKEELKTESKVGDRRKINIMVFILSIMAGWVDTLGVELFLQENSSFMTGRVRALGLYIFNSNLGLFLKVSLVIMAFITGAGLATIVTERAGLEGGLFCTGILVLLAAFPLFFRNINVFFLPMAMGCQNAASSLTPLNRTSHLTGPLTDLGVNLAKKKWDKVLFWGLRLIGFPLGVFIGFKLIKIISHGRINKSIGLIIPGLLIIFLAILQDKIFKIPLLD